MLYLVFAYFEKNLILQCKESKSIKLKKELLRNHHQGVTNEEAQGIDHISMYVFINIALLTVVNNKLLVQNT